MSDKAPTVPLLAKHGSKFIRQKAKERQKKEHNFDARNYHQNANRHGIHSLVAFDCPICQCKNTIRIDLDTKNRLAFVRCTYCMSIKPRPADLPYPFKTSLVPRLENKADAFFKFSEAYRRLAQQSDGGTAAASSSSTNRNDAHTLNAELGAQDDGGLLGGLNGPVANERESHHSSSDEGESTDRDRQEEGEDDEGSGSEDITVDDVDAFFDEV